jgi:hypothetical protein
MVANATMVAAGLLLIGLTLSDVFETVVVPGGSRAWLRVSRRLASLLLPMWKLVRHHRGISAMFAPVVLVLSFAIWMLFLSVGFGLAAFGLRSGFTPPLKSFWDALFVVSSSLATIGLSGTETSGSARWIVLMAGFCGLGVITLAVTYLLEVQNNIARRDAGIIKLNTAAGDPPCALGLLEKFARIDNQRELHDVLHQGRDWCATVRQSHCSHPSLIYFQSVNTGAGWPAALGALIDLALVVECIIGDNDLRGPAIMLREEALRMAAELTSLLHLTKMQVATREGDVADLIARIHAARYSVPTSPDLRKLAARRSEQQSCVNALAEHLGKPATMLVN